MKLMMESYELKKNAASEDLESQKKTEKSENDEAATLGTFNEAVDIKTEIVIAEVRPTEVDLAGTDNPDTADSSISADPAPESPEQISASSPEIEDPETEKNPPVAEKLEPVITSEPTPDKIQESEDISNPDGSINSEFPEPGPSLQPESEDNASETNEEATAKSEKSEAKETEATNDTEIPLIEVHTETVEDQSIESEIPAYHIDTEPSITMEELIQPHDLESIDDDDDLLGDGEPDLNAVHVQDYSSYSKLQLISTLRKMMEEASIEEVRPHAEAIKACFYKLRNAEIQEMKQAFIAEGNEEVLFEPEPDALELELKDLLKEYKNQRAEINKKQDAVKEENYQKKLAIIDEIKSLINSEESLNITFQEFNELQDKWRKIGQVPQSRVKDLWENYHYHVELFYDFVKINRELRDLDLKRNMDVKLELCKKAEDLSSNNTDALSAFRDLQKLHESWREIGPVPRENKQELWDRFKAATSQINKRYQQFFEQERLLQKEQLQKKIELCELAEQYAAFVSENPREWNDITDKVIALQEEWKKSGYGPRKENAKIWERFRAANDAFFQSKRNFWNKSKDHLNKNLALKLEICDQAEKLKESEDWKATTDKMITLQKKWKEIGPVPRKQSELIWKRFRTACDEFFNRKTQHFSGITGDQDENYKAKKALLAEIEVFIPSENAKESIEALKKFQERWSEIGFVPFRKKEELQTRYHTLIESQFDKLKLDDQDLVLYKFKSKIEHLASIPGGWSKINIERDRCSQHLKQLESDINTLANNVGFFGSSKGAQSLIQGVNAQIEKTKSQIDYLKAKIKIIDEQDEMN
jgi:hypothetical protein